MGRAPWCKVRVSALTWVDKQTLSAPQAVGVFLWNTVVDTWQIWLGNERSYSHDLGSCFPSG